MTEANSIQYCYPLRYISRYIVIIKCNHVHQIVVQTD